MGTPLYSTDIKTVPNRPELSALDAGDFYLVYDTSTGKISRIKKTNIDLASVKVTYDNTSSGMLADNLQEAVDETVNSIGSLQAEKENLSNKKSTLVENSEIYYPNQKAVNDGLNLTMAEIMGFAPRNLMDVFGTLTVPATFEALRDYLTASGGCDFSILRLGDYIDLDSFTVNNWYNGAAYDSTTGAWDTTVTVTKNLSYENTRVEIVGFSDYRYVGNTAYPSSPHVTFQFKNIPLKAPMHKLNVAPYYQTSQQYSGSDLVTIGLAEWYTAIASQFGTAIPYSVDRYIATTDGTEWAGAEKLFLPTGMNIFGHPGFAHAQRGVGTQSIFPLYTLNPDKRMKKFNGSSRQYWWLAEPSAGSASHFTFVHARGSLYYRDSYDSYGVAPAFLI